MNATTMTSARIAWKALRRPWILALLVALALVPLAWRGLAGLGISTRDLAPAGVLYELAFVGSLLGALFGLRLADEWAWITSRWRPGEILRHETVLMGLPILGLVAPPIAWGLAGAPGLDPVLAAAALLALARPLAMGLALQRLRLAPMARDLGLLALCWWIPAIAAPSFPPGPGLVARLAAEPGGAAVLATSGPWVAEISVLLALLLAARLGLGSETRRS